MLKWLKQSVAQNVRLFRKGRLDVRRLRPALARPHVEILEKRTLLNAGDIDPGFGNFITEFTGPLAANASASLIQPDGKIVVVGTTDNGISSQASLVLARYNVDGSLDPSFGTGGKAVNDFAGLQRPAIALEPDGKIVIVGTTGTDLGQTVVFRYTSSGSLDSAFGTNGRLTPDFGRTGGVVIQPDGKIIINGSFSGGLSGTTFVMARYQPDGTLDPSFGTGGKVSQTSLFVGGPLALQPDGKIVVAGEGLARFNANGSLDTSFANGGSIRLGFGAFGTGVAVQADSKIAVAIRAEFHGMVSYALSRFTTIGSADVTFGNGTGSVPTFGASGLALQADGKIMILGTSFAPPLTVGRYNTDGSADTGFGTSGRVEIASASFGGSSGLALQGDGRIVVLARFANQFDLGALRLNTDGSADSTFGTNGRITTRFVGTLNSSATGVAVQPDGKVVVSGTVPTGFALARYNSDGSLDITFGNGGRVTTDLHGPDFGDLGNQAVVAVQPDGQIVVAGSPGSRGPLNLARYNSNGSLDASFGAGGIVQVDPTGSLSVAVAVQSNGKIVLAINSRLFRFNSNGSADTSFGTGGVVSNVVAHGLALQTDGKILIAGFLIQDVAAALFRFNADGTLDTSFGTGGRVVTARPSSADGVAVQADGKILAVSPLSRYQSDGTPDINFGVNGITSGVASFMSFVSVRADGRIVLVNSGLFLAELKPNGNRELIFGNNGVVTTHFTVSGLTLQPDGKIIVVGAGVSSHSAFAVARYLADGPATLTPNQLFVSQVYVDLLQRLPEPAGLNFWTGSLDHGSSRTQVVLSIQASPEYHAALVKSLYRRLLNRPADDSGLTTWVNFLNRGGTAEQVEAGILGSEEYFSRSGMSSNPGFLQALYTDVLHRPIDDSGLRSWSQALTQGASRSAVAAALLSSQESDGLEVQELYHVYLHRDVDSGGLAAFTSALQRGVPNELILAILVSSDEYFGGL